MTHWMRQLAQHYETMRRRHPHTPLTIVFDIDGTLLDTRPALDELLRRFDAQHGTAYFAPVLDRDLCGLPWPELVARSGVPRRMHTQVCAQLRRLWNAPDAALASHQPFRGVLEVIRWFQLQPHTHVALNTGRPESQRLDTLRVLNNLAHEYRVTFSSELLFMRADAEADVLAAKRLTMAKLRERGYRPFAVVDNEYENLEAMQAADDRGEVLAVQSLDLHHTRRAGSPSPPRADYDLRQLINGRDLPRHVQFVWENIAGEGELQRFLTSGIHWGEAVVTAFRDGQPFVGDGALSLDRILSATLQRARRCKLRVTHPDHLPQLLAWFRAWHFPTDALWFDIPETDAPLELARRLAEAMPDSIRQCAIDQLAGNEDVNERLQRLRKMANAGVNRFSLAWASHGKATLLDDLDLLGCDVHLHGIPDLEAFLHATLLLPRSVGTDFDFPQLTARPQRRRYAG